MPKSNSSYTILHTNDTLSDVITSINNIGNDCTVYVPDKMFMLYNPINRKVLAKFALSKKNNTIQFYSPDQHLVNLLRDLNLDAATSEPMNIPEPEEFVKQEDPFSDFFRYDTDTDFDLSVDTNSTSSAQDNSSLWRYIITGFVAAVLVSVTILGLILPKANITLTSTGEPLLDELEITLDTTVSNFDIEESSIPLYREELLETATLDLESTGISESGNRATSQIKVINESNTSQSLVSNTRFLSVEGKQFRTTFAINIPAGGETEVEILADEAGEEYNIDPGKLSIPGLAGLGSRATQIYGQLEQPITNGNSENQSIVTQVDLDDVKNRLQEQLILSFNNSLNNLPDGQIALIDELNLDDISIQFTNLPDLGAVGEKIPVSAEANLNIFTYSNNDLKSFVLSRLETEIPENREILDTINTQLTEGYEDINGGRLDTIVKVEYFLLPNLEIDSLKNQLRGRPVASIENLLQNEEFITEIQVEMSPSFVPIFPVWPNNINISIQ